MKKSLFTLMCLFAMIMAANLSAKAQEITINLMPGWTWISYTKAEVMDLATAFGDFTPVEGDMVKSQFGFSFYENGRWAGNLTHFTPGLGYKYYSNRTELVSFVFGSTSSHLIVTTAEPLLITTDSAMSGGEVTTNDGTYILMKGLCWAAHENPTTNNDFCQEAGSGVGSFTISMTGLNIGTTYYVRAYAVTPYGTVYGNQKNFTTENGTIGGNAPIGAINGKFTINENGDQVYFSQGNLQYIGSASTPYWKFADNQWDVFGDTTGQNSSDLNVDRDLFGWGTSGWHDSNDLYNVNYLPWFTSTNNMNSSYNEYGYGPSTNMSSPNLTGSSANYDWGVYNPISNGGNQPNKWRTLTQSEWNYVFNNRRTSSGFRYVMANVNNIYGIILLPDEWNVSYYNLINPNSSVGENTITSLQWSTLEQHGAVFLPSAGFRIGTLVNGMGSVGYYWSASYCDSSEAYSVRIPFINLQFEDKRYMGDSVRLVAPVEN